MPKPKSKKRKSKIVQVAEDFAIGRSAEPIKPPTQKELDAMKQREIIRKNPHKSI